MGMRIERAAVLLVGAAIVGWLVVGTRQTDIAVDVAGARPGAMRAASSASGSGERAGTAVAQARSVLVRPPEGTASAPVAGAVSAPSAGTATDAPAAWSLADSRVAGDDRTPPIQRPAPESDTPAWQLDDHQAYARREQDRHRAVREAFVEAADRELPLLDRQIEQGRAMGLPAELLAKGEEKRRRIAEMRARMQAEPSASAPRP